LREIAKRRDRQPEAFPTGSPSTAPSSVAIVSEIGGAFQGGEMVKIFKRKSQKLLTVCPSVLRVLSESPEIDHQNRIVLK
jgi:hypothetical protein